MEQKSGCEGKQAVGVKERRKRVRGEKGFECQGKKAGEREKVNVCEGRKRVSVREKREWV